VTNVWGRLGRWWVGREERYAPQPGFLLISTVASLVVAAFSLATMIEMKAYGVGYAVWLFYATGPLSLFTAGLSYWRFRRDRDRLRRDRLQKNQGLAPDGSPLSPPAGWFPDPARRFCWRYWNGRGWSDLASNGGTSLKDPLA
jgi:hypothetical protein